jgi:hypothetical protein
LQPYQYNMVQGLDFTIKFWFYFKWKNISYVNQK